ncbi:MAG: DUF5009 domain-containing protein [bacterium]
MTDSLQPIKPGRLLSLDIFRGITIAGMFQVNNAGDWGHVWSPLEHAEWNGCTATDLIFPWFLFIVGVAMPFSFARRLESGAQKNDLIPQIIRRACLIFLVGAAIHLESWFAIGNFDWASPNYRIAGVLQRIALCYLFASLIMISWDIRGVASWFAVLLLGYWALMTLVPVPPVPEGVEEQYRNLASYIDRTILGPTCYKFDRKLGIGIHDPEGLLSTLPAIATTLSGILTGYWLRAKEKSGYEKVAGLFVAGFALIVLGMWWDYFFPMNKNLWTSSYVLFTSGWGLATLGVCYWLVDIKGITTWAKPFAVYGVNAIAAYVGVAMMSYATILIHWTGPDGKNILLKTWLYNTLFKSWIPALFNDYASSAAYAFFTYVVLWCGIMWIFYRKKIYIKL